MRLYNPRARRIDGSLLLARDVTYIEPDLIVVEKLTTLVIPASSRGGREPAGCIQGGSIAPEQEMRSG
jgi:hypothetical protein